MNECRDGWKTTPLWSICREMWNYSEVLAVYVWGTEFAVSSSLSVCKGIYMKNCIKVQSIVFQIIVDSIGLNGYILKWWNASRKFLEKIMASKGAF